MRPYADIHEFIDNDASHREVLDDFASIVRDAGDVARITSLLLDYGRFSHPFAGCALHLAATIHLATDLFSETAAAKIASLVLAAAEDEFFDYRSGRRTTHRDLCYAMMNGVADFGGSRRGRIDEEAMLRLSRRTRNGYRFDAASSPEDVFHALGFHAASEFAGSREFTIVDRCLRTSHPDLVSFLLQRRCEEDLTAYSWVELHVSIEKEHFHAAAGAVELADRSYSGILSRGDRWRFISEGFGAFFDLLRRFTFEERSVQQ